MPNKQITYTDLENKSLINRVDLDIQIYYDPATDSFVPVSESDGFQELGITWREFSKFVKLPCDNDYSNTIWCKFYEILTELETDVARSYPYRYGYFNYLRETGLIGRYEEAKELSAFDVISDWEIRNNVFPDWETAHIS